jgi:hypothetical protein
MPLIDYTLVYFQTKEERQKFCDLLGECGYKQFRIDNRDSFQQVDALQNCRELRYHDPDNPLPPSSYPDFAIWPVIESRNLKMVHPLEVIDHNNKMEEILKMVGDNGEVVRGFNPAKCKDLANIDFKNWLGEEPFTGKEWNKNLRIVSIDIEKRRGISYSIIGEYFDDDCGECAGHWRSFSERQSSTCFMPSSPNMLAVRKKPTEIKISKDGNGEIESIYIA